MCVSCRNSDDTKYMYVVLGSLLVCLIFKSPIDVFCLYNGSSNVPCIGYIFIHVTLMKRLGLDLQNL